MGKYQINLFYGYEENESGIYHSFIAEDPDEEVNGNRIAENLAFSLDCVPEDDRFNYDSMYIDLPNSLIERIRRDAVQEFIQSRPRIKKAVNIQWDTDGDETLAAELPQEILIPDDIVGEDKISDYISDQTGFCHFGFELVET